MRTRAIVISLLLVLGLFAAACSRQEELVQDKEDLTKDTVEPEPETTQYIDSQLIDPEENIEIGEMI